MLSYILMIAGIPFSLSYELRFFFFTIAFNYIEVYWLGLRWTADSGTVRSEWLEVNNLNEVYLFVLFLSK